MADRTRVDGHWKEFGGEVGSHCRFCEERHVGCHADCEKYKEAKQRHESFKQTVYENKNRELEGYRYKLQKIKSENRKSKWKQRKGG